MSLSLFLFWTARAPAATLDKLAAAAAAEMVDQLARQYGKILGFTK